MPTKAAQFQSTANPSSQWAAVTSCGSGSQVKGVPLVATAVWLSELFLRVAATKKKIPMWNCAQAVGGEPQKDLLHHWALAPGMVSGRLGKREPGKVWRLHD